MPRKARRRPHNTVTVYQRGPGNFWVAFRIDGRRRYWRGFGTFDQAERARAKLAGNIAAGNVGLPIERAPVAARYDCLRCGYRGGGRAQRDVVSTHDHSSRGWRNW